MATIPIEVIVQDAETPVTPTPIPADPSDPGENTNITVPETGAGIVDSNNGNSMSSPATIIVSIVIAVLAICTVITLLIRKYNKRKISESGITRQEKRAMVATSTIAVLALTVLLSQLVVAGVVSPIATNAATDDTVNDEAELNVDSKITIIAARTEDEDTVVATVKNTSTATSHQTFGYKVTASMAADATTANLYLNGDEASEYYIAPVKDDTLANNTWGYTLEEESEDYLPIPLATDPTTIVKGYDNIADESVDIYYTIQVDKDLPAGTYTGELEYGIDPAIEYMQDLAAITSEEKSTLLTNMAQDEQYILEDNRDEKSYYISKLADGNIWMTQNLNLDLSTEVTFTPADTDIANDWTPVNNTIRVTGTKISGFDNYSTPSSADLGDIYYYTSGNNDNDIQYNSLAECEAAGHMDCAHYHAGNYYNWSAAVANNDTSEMTGEYLSASSSICPAGWRLPKVTASQDGTSYYSDYTFLLYSSGIISTTTGRDYTENGFTNLRSSPLYFTRGSNVQNNDSLPRPLNWGRYLNGTMSIYYGSQVASVMSFDIESATGGSLTGFGWGFLVRCMMR